MNTVRARSVTVLVVLIALVTAQLVAQRPLNDTEIKFTSLANNLMLQRRDFRYAFFSTRKAFETFQAEGVTLLTYGTANNVKKVSTNECPTVESVLNTYARGVSNFQIRIIQKDLIVQTPVPKKENIEAVKALLKMRLHSGDIIILTLVD